MAIDDDIREQEQERRDRIVHRAELRDPIFGRATVKDTSDYTWVCGYCDKVKAQEPSDTYLVPQCHGSMMFVPPKGDEMSVDLDKIPSHVLECIRQNLGADGPEDESFDEQIGKMSAERLFGRFCEWNGLIDYGPTLIAALDILRAAEPKGDTDDSR